MKETVVPFLVCPACHSPLTATAQTHKEPEIWLGQLACTKCLHTYPIKNGLPLLYVNNESWQSKAIEADGWVIHHKNQGIYDVVENAVDLQIPYYPQEPWIQVARSFNVALEYLTLTGNETILDLGAGRGWAAKEFAKRGCQVVALDVVPDENVGLGRARALMDHAGVYFDRLIADGENLPFLPDTFDIVFCAAALHHATNLLTLFQNISRVLKPGGTLCAINEPCISIIENEKTVLKRDATAELEMGINETRPNLLTYHQGLTQAGLSITTATAMDIYGHSPENIQNELQNSGTLLPAFQLQHLAQSRKRLTHFFVRRIFALRQGTLFQARKFARLHSSPGEMLLLWRGGELFLIAKKGK